MERCLTVKETEPWEILYFKAYKSQLTVIERAGMRCTGSAYEVHKVHKVHSRYCPPSEGFPVVGELVSSSLQRSQPSRGPAIA